MVVNPSPSETHVPPCRRRDIVPVARDYTSAAKDFLAWSDIMYAIVAQSPPSKSTNCPSFSRDSRRPDHRQPAPTKQHLVNYRHNNSILQAPLARAPPVRAQKCPGLSIFTKKYPGLSKIHFDTLALDPTSCLLGLILSVEL